MDIKARKELSETLRDMEMTHSLQVKGVLSPEEREAVLGHLKEHAAQQFSKNVKQSDDKPDEKPKDEKKSAESSRKSGK